MKKYLNIIALFISFQSFCLCSTDAEILTKGSIKEFSTNDGLIIFDVSDFSVNDEIRIEVRATNFNGDQITATFFDDLNADSANYNFFDENSFKSETKDGFTYKYYIIKKSQSNLGSLNGKYLALNFPSDNTVYIKLTDKGRTISNTTTDSYLKKYGTITVLGSDGGFIMDTSDFKNNDEIYLKITATYFINSRIYYEFIDDLNTYNPSSYYEDYDYEYSSKTDYNNDNTVTKYYTIKKNSHLYNNIKGNYMVVYFECTGHVTIVNTKENEGKLSTGAIIGIVIACVVVVVIIIIYCIYRRKKLAQLAGMTNGGEAVVDNNQNYNNNNQNYAQNYNQNQNYNNNYNQNYNQNYNIDSNNQMNAQYYNNDQQQNYANADVGYTSKV